MPDLLSVGHASYDVTFSASHHPQADEKMLADSMNLAGGGPAANAAVCAARLGGSAGFCGYLGSDLFGEAHLRELQAQGVACSLVVRGDAPTPVSQILAKPDGCRSVVNFKGETPWLAADAVSLSDMPKVILFDGHEPLLSARLCHQAREHQIPTVLDAGSLHRGTGQLAGMVDYLVASEKFARQWCDTDNMQQALTELAAVCETVVITLGAHGLIWARGSERGVMEAFSVHAIDSTGAGDAFHGAFALGVARKMAWPELLRFASAAGALTCTKLGARYALPDQDELSGLLAEQEENNADTFQ